MIVIGRACAAEVGCATLLMAATLACNKWAGKDGAVNPPRTGKESQGTTRKRLALSIVPPTDSRRSGGLQLADSMLPHGHISEVQIQTSLRQQLLKMRPTSNVLRGLSGISTPNWLPKVQKGFGNSLGVDSPSVSVWPLPGREVKYHLYLEIV